MRRSKLVRRSLLSLALASLSAASFSVVLPTSAYDFNGTLAPYFAANAHVGNAEVRTGADPTSAGSPTYVADTVGSTSKQVLSLTADSLVRVLHGIGANGGGFYVNQYTILMDVKFNQTTEPWSSLYNTNADNANDGDAWVQWGVGIGTAGTYGGTVPNNAWTRIVFSIDLAASQAKFYIDGNLASSPAGIGGIDGGRSMYSWDDGDSDSDAVDMLADNDGEDVPSRLSQLAFYDHVLSDAEVAGLGRVGSVVPEPTTFAVLGLGALALRRRRK